MTRNVYIVNRGPHDFSPAEKFGSLVFLSEGNLSRHHTSSIIRTFQAAMEESTEDDYIVPCSLSIASSLACAIFAHKHGKLNLLLFKDGVYLERNHVL